MTLNDFIKLRSSKPIENDIVEIWAIEGFETWRDNQVHTLPSVRLTERDCVAFVGMSVFFHTDHYSETLAKNFEMLKKFAEYILVAITDFGDDLGFEYRKELQ